MNTPSSLQSYGLAMSVSGASALMFPLSSREMLEIGDVA